MNPKLQLGSQAVQSASAFILEIKQNQILAIVVEPSKIDAFLAPIRCIYVANGMA
jgi:hypothetical protein